MTWTLVNKEKDIAKKWRVWIKIDQGTLDYGLVVFKFDHDPTEAEIQVLVDNFGDQHKYDNVQKEDVIKQENTNLALEIMRRIKANPSLTLAQYNNYLATLPWYEAARIRLFVWELAQALAQNHGVTLDNMTETQVLLKVRNYIVNTPAKKLAKIVLGHLMEF